MHAADRALHTEHGVHIENIAEFRSFRQCTMHSHFIQKQIPNLLSI